MGQGLQMRPDRARDVIMACAILHNISKDMRQPEEDKAYASSLSKMHWMELLGKS